MSPASATLVGFTAIAQWGVLALLTAASGTIPPFQMNAMCFLVGGLVGLAAAPFRPGALRALAQPWRVWAVGVGGLFGYHALYFAALRLAPPAEASLVCYLWPLLIVVLSGLLPGERLKGIHVAGALVGFAGVVALSAGRGLTGSVEHLPGYLLALAAAVFWAGYSILSRRAAEAPTDAVAGFCLATAALSLACHLAFETTVLPEDATQWLAILALGIGPVGAAFYAWDVGVKRGDIRLLGVGAYSAPVISTIALVLAGYAEPTAALGLACALIVGGALVASADKLSRGKRPPAEAG